MVSLATKFERIPAYPCIMSSNSSDRILLSPPRATESDIASVAAAMRSDWLAPAGPDLTAFESEVAEYLGTRFAVGLSSGTAALHLGLKYLGVKAGDYVIVPTATFGATSFAVTYLGATPVFVDIDGSHNLDPAMLELALVTLKKQGRPCGAVVPVDLYGTAADYSRIQPIAEEFETPMLVDAAEALGAWHGEKRAGVFGDAGVLSFNGNKIITTSGGGMLVTDDERAAVRIRKWASQSRENVPWYEHEEVGFNYRLSNVLAALGRSQLVRVDDEVAKRRQIREWYRERLEAIPGVRVQSDPPWGRSNAWLTIVRFAREVLPSAAGRVRLALADDHIESRPTWKPMHQQPVFKECPSFLSGSADALFEEGLCLPSGTALEASDIDRICSIIESTLSQ